MNAPTARITLKRLLRTWWALQTRRVEHRRSIDESTFYNLPHRKRLGTLPSTIASSQIAQAVSIESVEPVLLVSSHFCCGGRCFLWVCFCCVLFVILGVIIFRSTVQELNKIKFQFCLVLCHIWKYMNKFEACVKDTSESKSAVSSSIPRIVVSHC